MEPRVSPSPRPSTPTATADDPHAAVASIDAPPSSPREDEPVEREPEPDEPLCAAPTTNVGTGVSAAAVDPPEKRVTKAPRARSLSAQADGGFFGTRPTRAVRAVVDHLSAPVVPDAPPSPPRDDEVDSQCTVMTETTVLYELSRRLPLTWDLVAWDAFDRRRLWYHNRTPQEGADPFRHASLEGRSVWVVFGLRPRNWTSMHENEYYPWLKHVTLEHLQEAQASVAPKGGVRAYDSTGLSCKVEVWAGVDDLDNLLAVEGSSGPSLGYAFFLSLFWKYRMACGKDGPLSGRELAQSWSAFYKHMTNSPQTIYDRLDEFYHLTMEGTLVRIHEVSRHHGLGCAVRKEDACPMCTARTPKLAPICREPDMFPLLPLEVRSYLAQLEGLQPAASKRQRLEE